MQADDLKARLLAWLAEEFEVASEQPPPSLPLDWVLKVSTKGPLKIMLTAQKPRGRDAVAFTIGIALTERHRKAFMELPERERIRLVVDVVKVLYSMCPDCVISIQPSLQAFKAIAITRIIYNERLDRAEALQTAKVLANMAIVVMLHFNSSLGVQAQPGEGSGGEGFMR